jgi:HemY protein
MVRVVLFLALVAALAFGAAWIADQPGTVTVRWLGRQIELEVLTGIIALVVAAVVVMMTIGFVKWLIASPAIASRILRRRRAERGQEAIQRGIVAIGAGDRRAAERHAAEAERLAPDAPLTLLLRAQAAQLAGDRGGAEQAFRSMIAKPETRVLGLRGLYVEAQRRADPVAARAIAEEAAKASQTAAWASQAVLEHQSAAGDWDGALASIERQYAARTIDKDQAKRLKAVLIAAKAVEAEDRNPASAKSLAMEAHGLAPGLVPAAAIAGRLLSADGDARKASKVIEAAWRHSPHPDLAEAYAHARQGDSRLDALKRVQYLARLTPSHPEGLLAIARAAIDAGDFAAAHSALGELTSGTPTQRACLLMAELVAKESSDHGRAREWMARALRAARDPVWTADGQVSDVWLPASPVSGRLDAFEWKVPVAEIGGPLLQVDDVLADAHEAPQPAPLIEIVAEPATTKTVETAAANVVELVPAPPAEPVVLAPKPVPAAEPAPKPRAVPTETVFPIARPPDDPGPDQPASAKRASLFGS